MKNVLKGGLSDNMTIEDIAKKHKCDVHYAKKQLSKGIKTELEHTKSIDVAKEIAMDHLYENIHYYSKSKDESLEMTEPKESTTASSSGSYSGSAFSGPILKRDIHKFHNSNLNEALGGTEMGSYDVPFLGKTPKGRRNPLKIDGPDSIKNSRAVKDKKFPKWGGPGGIFIKIKDKCKKFPYCNQGDINAIEVLKESIDLVSKEKQIPKEDLEKLVINEIKKIFIEYEN